MKYCNGCGQLLRELLTKEGLAREVCAGCGAVHYANPRVTVRCAVLYRDSLLLCCRARQPARGKWEIPSGFLECGETLEAGAGRETLEETGVYVDPHQLELYAITDMPFMEQIAFTFRTELNTPPQLRPNAESSLVAFIPFSEIAVEQLAWSGALGNRSYQMLREMRTREFSIHLNSIGLKDDLQPRWREYAVASVQSSES